jgi:hypothetical protein
VPVLGTRRPRTKPKTKCRYLLRRSGTERFRPLAPRSDIRVEIAIAPRDSEASGNDVPSC